MNMKRSFESWQPRAKLQGSAKAQWLNLSNTSGGPGSKTPDTYKKAHRLLQCGSQRLARAQCRTEQRVWFCETSHARASRAPCAPTSESDPDDFDYGPFWD